MIEVSWTLLIALSLFVLGAAAIRSLLPQRIAIVYENDAKPVAGGKALSASNEIVPSAGLER